MNSEFFLTGGTDLFRGYKQINASWELRKKTHHVSTTQF